MNVVTSPAPVADNAVVTLRNLSRAFAGRTVLRDVSLDIAAGEFVALVGRSGSGKSTLLRAIADLDDEAGKSGTLQAPDAISVLFQDSRLLPWADILGNVTLGLSVPGALERGRQALADVGLAGRERAWPGVLSGGEQQRVALARSLVREPVLLLADEPFGALDALTRIKMHDLLFRLVRAHRPAVLLVTHDVEEALVLADRVLVMEDGRFAAERRIDLAHPRRPADPHFSALKAEILAELGVSAAA